MSDYKPTQPLLAETPSPGSQRGEVAPAWADYILPGADVLDPAQSQEVSLRGIVETETWRLAQARLQLPVVLGRDEELNPVIPDLTELPHILMAGHTGSGKSVCIDGIITSLLLSFTREALRFVMFDLHGAQFQIYNSLPHLAFPVVTDPRKVLLALRWLLDEAERRDHLFARVGVRDIQSFNTRSSNNQGIVTADSLIPDQIPFLVVFVDELGALISGTSGIELALARLADRARAVGIHLILSTQTPRAEIITGLVKSNIPTRIAFKVVSKVESRLIIDREGAEDLPSPGHMLFLPIHGPMKRVQGVFVTENEAHRIVKFVALQSPTAFQSGALLRTGIKDGISITKKPVDSSGDITFNCPHCGQHLSVEQKGAGMSVNCPNCNEQIEIPRSTAPLTPPPIPP